MEVLVIAVGINESVPTLLTNSKRESTIKNPVISQKNIRYPIDNMYRIPYNILNNRKPLQKQRR